MMQALPSDESFSRIGGVAAIVGGPLLLVATSLHPRGAHPMDMPAAFAEYAADRMWVATHLGQLAAVVLITAGLVSLSWRLRGGRAGVWAALGAVAALASLSVAGALQAVDGIALKNVVDRWAQAAPDSRALALEAAVAVRQVEIGLASILILFVGLTAALYAAALWSSEEAPSWLGWVGMAVGVNLTVAGVMYAYSGFSNAAMTASMSGSLALIVWTACIGVYLLRSTRAAAGAI
jgi:hypothetical protein